MTRLRTRLSKALTRPRRADIERLYVQLLDRLPRDPSLLEAYANFVVPSGWPEQAPPARVQAAARDAHEKITSAIDARPPLDMNTVRALRRTDARVLAWADDVAASMNSAIASCGRLDDEAFAVLRNFATWRTRAEDTERAIIALESARRCAGHRPEIAQDLGALRFSQGQVVEALRLFREALLVSPDDPDRMRDVAAALLAAGESTEALSLLERACTTPTSRCLLDLAGAHAESAHPERAAAYARQALPLAAADDPEPSLVLGAALVSLGLNTQAREAYEEAIRRAPEDPRARRSLQALDRPAAP